MTPHRSPSRLVQARLTTSEKKETTRLSVDESCKNDDQNVLVAVEFNELLILLLVYTIVAKYPRKILTEKIKTINPKSK